MICPNCGTENRPGAKFCSECATALAAGCPVCGTINPPTAKFCSECATALTGARAAAGSPTPSPSVSEPVAERRLVSVLFADLVGFTTFAEGRDSEDVRETLTKYFELATEVVGRYGGTVEKFIGDAVMAVWGTPTTREDDAERAVRAGLELLDAIHVLGSGISARAGVLTGEAAVTLGATNQGMVAGDIVNTASRLQSAAAPGTVLVGEATQRAAASAIVFEPAGDQDLKGKAAPVAAWRAVRVVAQRGGRGRADTLEAPFVGRDEELRQLKELFHATVREGRPRLISTIGPGGIGKTRLAWEFLKYLDGLADTVWWHAGRSPAYGDGITFWALGEMVRRRAGLAETDDEATTRTRIAATVRIHVPDPAEARWIESALLALLGFEGGIAADQLFGAWRTFFERLSASNPVVMVFEDLHHADKGLLDFIDHLMEWSRGVPILVITLARPELLERRPDWGAGKRSFASIYLEPLPPAEMERLLAGLVPGLPRKAVAGIVARADGIPLYAVETVRMLLAQGRLVRDGETYRPVGDLDDVAVPETLTALIAARLDGLDAADRDLVADAAVLGQSFSLPGLAAVSGLAVEALEPRLRSLVRRELLVLDADPRSPERGQYAFVQALIREVAYNTLSKRDRKVRHLAAARFFESLETDELAGGLAGHYLAAQRLAADAAEADALAAQARISLRAAAERAATLGSHDQARTFLEQALDVTTDPVDRAELHERAIAAAYNELDVGIITGHADGLLAERRRTDDRQMIAMAEAIRARAYGSTGDPRRGLDMVLAAWAEFSDLEETPAGVAILGGIGRAYRGIDDTAASMPYVDRVLPIAERLGLLEETARAIIAKGANYLVRGRPREGYILLRGAHALTLAHDLKEELSARVLTTFYEQWNEPAVGLALGREGFEISRRLGNRAYGANMVGNSAINALRVGEWDWAATTLDEWLAGEFGTGQVAEFYVDRAIFTALRGGDPAADIAVAAKLREGMTDPQYESYELWARAVAAFSVGDLAACRSLCIRLVENTSYFAPLTRMLAVRAALWDGDAAEAARITAAISCDGYWGLVLSADDIAARAGIAALEGRTADSVALYREAIRAYRGLGVAFDEAGAVVDMATLLPASELAAPDLAEAIATARTTLERLGARPFLDRLGSSPGPAGARQRPASTPTRASEATPSR